ncbi:MAG: hypothetical protein A3G81_14580 [Betaproteobacteria bacterium RIFCSPLOWO2_12_FULL_65_14]|nr:MAG: hypothetical protein A3G81_14580 [Betaproteobacteria bacterium RIFCSPLOWO2_12_FULL_65_14]
MNRRLLGAFSRRTVDALRSALPLRAGLPPLEQFLAHNVAKEVRKDTLVIRRAAEAPAGQRRPAREALLELLQSAKQIDREFLRRVVRFPIGIDIPYAEIDPLRLRRMERLFAGAQSVFAAWPQGQGPRQALRAAFAREELERLLVEILGLYAQETLALSRGVRLPALLRPVRELAMRRLVGVMDSIARRLAMEAARAVYA